MADGAQPLGDDRGALMRRWLLNLANTEPFPPFVIRSEGGFETKVPSIESLTFERGGLAITVHQTPESFEVIPVDRIVSLKII